ncbi:MAG: hypothetical protein KC478_04515 [Bacteriovoracaceae bacterium]|nr:hypothetical protein [Bacteriovoracaceae bacterium]
MNKTDFEDFLNDENQISPSHKMADATMTMIKEEMSPSNVTIFTKLIFVQLATGLLTMLFCPQFNMSLTNNYELFHYFHHTFGEQICMVLCGGIFLGSGALVAAYTLKESEIKEIFRQRFLHLCTISGISIAVFMTIGADVYLSMIPYWIVGSVVFGILSLITNYKLRNLITA